MVESDNPDIIESETAFAWWAGVDSWLEYVIIYNIRPRNATWKWFKEVCRSKDGSTGRAEWTPAYRAFERPRKQDSEKIQTILII